MDRETLRKELRQVANRKYFRSICRYCKRKLRVYKNENHIFICDDCSKLLIKYKPDGALNGN